MALEEVLLLSFAVGGGIKVAMEAVLDLAHKEVARVDFSVDSDLRVRHQ